MKTFEDVIEDVRKLEGLELKSINPGSNIVILEVDLFRKSVVIKTSKGQTKTRPFSEIQRIWNEMLSAPAVHVDSILRGSGSSRNQPETILANLPYVEYLKINGKKHIAYVERDTHPYGILREMDGEEADAVRARMDGCDDSAIQSIVVSEDAKSVIESLQSACPGTTSALEYGVYVFRTMTAEHLVIASGVVNLEEGTYIVLSSPNGVLPTSVSRRLSIRSRNYVLLEGNGLKLLVRESENVSDRSTPYSVRQNQPSEGRVG